MSDYDGDIVFTSDNPTMIKCKYYDTLSNLPITYAKNTVPKKIIKESELWKADIKSFDTKIGQITNYSTSFYCLIQKYKNDNTPHGRKCYDELIERLKLTRKSQGDEIDHAKGIATNPYPKHWITKQFIDPDDSPELKAHKEFLNEICGDKKPEFFKYRYYKSGSAFKTAEESNEICNSLTPDHTNQSNLLTYDSDMNKIFHYMESNLKALHNTYQSTRIGIPELLKTTNEPLNDPDKIQIIQDIANDYFDRRKIFKQGLEKEYADIHQYIAHIQKDVVSQYLTSFESMDDLINYVVEVCYVRNYKQSKSFAWNVFGEFLIQNLIRNTPEPITLPLRRDCGSIEYLYNHYDLYELSHEFLYDYYNINEVQNDDTDL